MPNLLRPWKKKGSWLLVLCIAVVVFGLRCSSDRKKNRTAQESALFRDSSTAPLQVDTFPILSDNKLQLTRAYNRRHYGIDGYRLSAPKMIVVHYTAIPDLQTTLDYFKGDSIATARRRIQQHSPLNVGVHYVVDSDGSIFNLLPDSVMARHLIGFNHVALGIENVAGDSTTLTRAQLNSNARLIHYLSLRHPSVKYLIGHQEYDDPRLAHYALLKAEDPAYQPYPKPDPGLEFLAALRQQLKARYGLVFEK